MFNPHIHHQQQQQQQQFHQHLRQIQQLFQQQVQPPPPPPPQPSAHHVPHPHQPPRPIPVPTQAAPPPRMVNLCQTTQTTIIAPNPMLQGALLMQQMQGNMRGFGMGGQQFRQFFAAGARSSLLGPVPMGVAIKSPMMGFPPARPVYPHVRYYNNTSVPGSASASASTSESAAARHSERKRDIEQITQDTSEDQPGPSTATEANEADNTVNPDDGDGCCIEEQLEEPEVKKQRTDGLEETIEQPIVCVVEDVVLSSDSDSPPGECGSAVGSEVLESENECTEVQGSLSQPEDEQHAETPVLEVPQDEDCLISGDNQDEEDVEEGSNKFYCYLCSITCLNQQNFRSHMNSISHQQRMMEIQHMSNACLVTLLPRLQDSLQGINKDGEKKHPLKRWCATCRTHFTTSSMDHRQTKEHKLARKMAISSCTVCKKHFRSPQIFIQHLQTLEHRKKVEMDNQGSEEQSKIPDGFLVEEEGGVSEDDENLSNAEDQEDSDKEDGGASREVTLEDVDDSVPYDPNVVYGSSFLVPVAGFICRLCNKFYHFESPDLHSHCKSSEHYENLKRYKTDQKCEASQKCVAGRELSTDLSPATRVGSKQPFISLRRLPKQANPQQSEKEVESNKAIQGFTISAPDTSCTDLECSTVDETTTSQTDGGEDSSASDSAVTRDSAAQSVFTEGNVEEKEVKNNSKVAMTTRRRTVRATNRR